VSVRDAFSTQARICAEMGSPFTARLCDLFAARLRKGDRVSERLLEWPGDAGGRADALPLRIAGALHGLVLEDRNAGLATVYPPNDTRASDNDIWSAIASAFIEHAGEILARIESPPQTNETMRCAALCPGFLTIAALTGLPLVTSELGASTGLNMNWDRFSYRFGPVPWGDARSLVDIVPDWNGPTPPLPPARVRERAGCDLAPPDLDGPGDRLRLLSYVWADQSPRMLRTAAAIELAQAGNARVDEADAPEWLAERLAGTYPGQVHVVYHSIFWQYLDAQAQAECRAALNAAGDRATEAAPLAWLRMEGDGNSPGAAITLTFWPSGVTRVLGRADFHGRWVVWTGWK
jgi:hypothetical protein